MTWLATTVTDVTSGNSTMGANTGLSRALNTVPSARRLTSFRCDWAAELGVGATAYTMLFTGGFGQVMPWLLGVSYVPTGDTVPNLSTSPDDVHFMSVWYNPEYYDRQTINASGAPSYKDAFSWHGSRSGRLQLATGVGGSTYFHIANNTGGTVVTAWESMLRISYA